MPLTRSPQKPQGRNISNAPITINTESAEDLNAIFEYATNDPPPSTTENVAPPLVDIGGIEQVASRFAKQFEDMQVAITQQMNAIQTMVDNNNLHMRASITSIQNEIRNPLRNNNPQVSESQSSHDIANNIPENTSVAANNNVSLPIVTAYSPIYSSACHSSVTNAYQFPLASVNANANQPLQAVTAFHSLPSHVPLATSRVTMHPTLYQFPPSSANVPQISNHSLPNNINYGTAPLPNTTNYISGVPPNHSISSQVLSGNVPHRHKKIYPLPVFSGLPEEWLTFLETFNSTTVEFEYSDLHNIMRLRDSLKGRALDTVESLLTNSRNVVSIMNILAETYGRPEQLIKSQIEKVRSLSTVQESDLNSFMIFANRVTNMTTFLESVGGDYHLANPMLLSELVAKMPLSKRVEWAQKSLALGRMPSIQDFSNWLHSLRRVINMVTDSLPVTKKESDNKSKRYAFVSVVNKQCKICFKNCKSLADCEEFSSLPLGTRWDTAKSLKVCFRCLKGGHLATKCFSKKQCNVDSCPQSHHPLLHDVKITHCLDVLPGFVNNSKEIPAVDDACNNPQTQARNCLVDENSASSVLFQVIPIRIYSPKGSVVVHALIDDEANISMIDHDVINMLGITGRKDVLELQWINSQVSRGDTEYVTLNISGLEDNAQKYNIHNVYVTSNLDLPTQSLNFDRLTRHCQNLSLKGVRIHDYENEKPRMIISLAHAFLTVPVETPKILNSSGPIVIKTRLGWVAYGPVPGEDKKLVSCHLRKSEKDSESLAEMNELMKSYFGLESFGIKTPVKPLISKDDERALVILRNTTRRFGDRYESGLLWRDEFKGFPESYSMAFKRLLTVERKMQKDSEFAMGYCNKIKEYVEKGYARIMSDDEAKIQTKKTFYLPHFGVINPNKKKLRFVFDAAAEVERVSLNKALLAGPDMNQPLLSVLMKFREARIAVCGDLKEMFHQVKIVKEDQDAQRFLWRNGDSSKPVKVYAMQRMIFGATCSPTIAQFVKNENAMEFSDKYPRAVKGIVEKHYVDDYVDCFDSEEEAVEVVKSIKKIHEEGGFEMHNMLTNSDVVAKELGIDNKNTCVNVGKTVERVLGMHWLPHSDKLIFVLTFYKVPEDVLAMKRVPSKRELLSVAMSVFDPFGFIANFVIGAKILMQEVWKSGIDWDDKLPDEINRKFQIWLQELSKLEEFQISRFYFGGCEVDDLQLHVFCDASEQAMAVVAYWRIQSNNGIQVSFVMGKSSCAPLRFHSIPRLELQAAVMAVRVKETIVKYHDIQVKDIYFWSDSHTVIRWIRSSHRRYKQYVANRVSEVLEGSEETEWHWCPTMENPADEATRATFPINFNPNSIWTNGADFLRRPQSEWPSERGMVKKEDKSEEELTKQGFILTSINCYDIIETLCSRTSRYLKIRRQIAWMLRFISNVRLKLKGGTTLHGELIVREEEEAEVIICRGIQKKCFSAEYSSLIARKPLLKSSDLISLNPYIDDKGILRVNGRLEHATILSENARRPIILPKNHRYTRLLIEYFHQKNCHQFSANVICEVRQRFWVPCIRRLLKSIEARCVVCKLRKAKPEQPQMGVLPKDRVTPFIRPFSYAGVDLFGPFDVKIRRGVEKRWVAIFTCLTVRAVHLEMVTNLSSEAFVLSLRNFINRRGVPLQIRSDNGRNFVGLKKELKNESDFLDHNEITKFLTPLGIKWIFNTPCDPSSGGAWERLIQSIKKSLSVLIRDFIPRLEVFQSLLIEAENIVNSRPLTHIPLNPHDAEPLTPNHFLMGATNSTQAPAEFNPDLMNTRKQWRILQNLKNGFWGRWIREYLPDLTRRVKWCFPSRPIQMGDLVLECNASVPRSKWRRGRIIKTYCGNDGVIRSADVRTQEGTMKRPASMLAKLDFAEDW